MNAWLKCFLGSALLTTGLAQAATPLVGVAMAKYDDNFQALLRNGVQQKSAAMDIDIFMENGQDNAELQMRQFRNLIHSKVDAIIVAVVDGKSTALVRRGQRIPRIQNHIGKCPIHPDRDGPATIGRFQSDTSHAILIAKRT